MQFLGLLKEKIKGIIKIREQLEDDFIVWRDNYEPQEIDYQGKPWGNLSGFDAITATKKLLNADITITSVSKGEIRYKIIRCNVTAIMSKSKSWIDPASKKYRPTSEILLHEKGHFMIEEAFARKLRKKLDEKIKNDVFVCKRINSEKPKITVSREAQNILNEVKEKCKKSTEACNKEYDNYAFDKSRKTNHSGQKEYYEKIKKMLQD